MEALQYVFYLLVTIGILVTIHEFGHYLVARASGVKILRFSVGFGRPLCTWVDKRGTEFTIAAIPLGGYLRMYEENEELIDNDFESNPAPMVAFNQLSPWWRIGIACGGPGANFLLAVVVYSVISMIGVTSFMPIVGVVEEGTPVHAAGLQSGEEIVRVDDRDTPTWSDVNMRLASRLGDTGIIALQTRWPGESGQRSYSLVVDEWHKGADEPDLMGSLGISIAPLAVIGSVVKGSPAERAGFVRWDRVVAVDERQIITWRDWVLAIREAPGVPMRVQIVREGMPRNLILVPDLTEAANGEVIGFAGLGTVTRNVQYRFFGAIVRGVSETAANTVMTLDFLKKMVTGLVSARNLGGPIMIAKVAKDSAQLGWQHFLRILALLSISLGVINLLPIPILDGGHILFASAEIVTRRPVSARIQALGLRLGLVVVVSVMLFTIYNDVSRVL